MPAQSYDDRLAAAMNPFEEFDATRFELGDKKNSQQLSFGPKCGPSQVDLVQLESTSHDLGGSRRATKTEQEACRTTRSAVLPNKNRVNPSVAVLPTTIKSGVNIAA